MEEWDWILQINLYGVIRGVRAFVPHLLERGTRLGREHGVGGRPLRVRLGPPGVHHREVRCRRAHRGARALPATARRRRVAPVPGARRTNMADTARFSGPTTLAAWIQEMPLSDPVEPAVAGRAVADAIRDDTFLVLTHPDEARDRMGDAAPISTRSSRHRSSACRRPRTSDGQPVKRTSPLIAGGGDTGFAFARPLRSSRPSGSSSPRGEGGHTSVVSS